MSASGQHLTALQSSARFHSPGPTRRIVTLKPSDETLAARISKKTRRSKSTDPGERDLCEKAASSPKHEPFIKGEVESRTETPECHPRMPPPPASSSRKWQAISKHKEKLSYGELSNNYQLLMSDHLRLEKFLSFLTKEHEKSKSKMESELLDAFMQMEDLKQALELRMLRKPRIDPKEAEERRSLIRQNKKLLRQLYDAARKIEKLDATLSEVHEQHEMTEFHLFESENQRAIVEEQLKKLTNKHKFDYSTQECQTMPCLCASWPQKQQQLENLIRSLKRENTDLRDQLASEEENSAAESDRCLTRPRARSLPRDSLPQAISQRVADRIDASLGLSNQINSRRRSQVSQQTMNNNNNNNNNNTTNSNNLSFNGNENSMKIDESNKEESNSQSTSSTGINAIHCIEFDENSAVGQLILQSFFPSTCMVPLEEEIITIRENLPSTKPKQEDSILAETIRTFQQLMIEKDEEIISLKNRLKELNVNEENLINTPGKFVMIATQTDMDAIDCEVMEKQVNCLQTEINSLKLANKDTLTLMQDRDRLLADKIKVKKVLNEILTNQIPLIEGGELNTNNLEKTSSSSSSSSAVAVASSSSSSLPLPSSALASSSFDSIDEQLKKLKMFIEKCKYDGKSNDFNPQQEALKRDIEMAAGQPHVQHAEDEVDGMDENTVRIKLRQLIHLENKWKSFMNHLGKGEAALLEVISEHEMESAKRKGEILALQQQLEVSREEIRSFTINQKEHDVGRGDGLDKGPRYYSIQLQEIKHKREVDTLQSKLGLCERRKVELENRLQSYSMELTRLRQLVEDLEASQLASKRMENSLKRRLQSVETMRMVSSNNSTTESPSYIADLEGKVAYLQSKNDSLVEAIRMEQKKLNESLSDVRRLEAEKRGLLDRFTELQSRDICNQKATMALQTKYEEIIGEYSEFKCHEDTWKTRSRGYDNLQSNLKQRMNDMDNVKSNWETERKNFQARINSLNATVNTQLTALKEKDKKYEDIKSLLQQYQQKFTETSDKLVSLEAQMVDNNSPRRSVTPTGPPPTENNSTVSRYLKERLAESERLEKQHWTRIQQLEENELKLNRRILQLECCVEDAKQKPIVSMSDESEPMQDILRQKDFQIQENYYAYRNLQDKLDNAIALSEAQKEENQRLRDRMNELQEEIASHYHDHIVVSHHSESSTSFDNVAGAK